MSDARTVLREFSYLDCGWYPHEKASDKCARCDGFADAILAALAEAGLTPPMPTGRLHKALQDAFQAGFLSAKRDPENFSGLIAKHEYCDAALKKLSEGSE